MTDVAGHFVLKGVPSGTSIPFAVQIGKWRRKVTLASVTACTDNPITDANLSRLPRSQIEGDIPQIALTTGGADAAECFLRRIGIADTEFTTAPGSGRVHLYAGSGGGTSQFQNAPLGAGPFASATTLWSTSANLLAYDAVILGCEGQTFPSTKPAAALQAMSSYMNGCGRVFAFHYHSYWYSNGPAPLPQTGNWVFEANPPDPSTGTISTAFAKGLLFANWMSGVGALSANDQFSIASPRDSLTSAGTSAQAWVTLVNPNAVPMTAISLLTFETPIGGVAGSQCGRGTFSDLHVGVGDTPGLAFPSECAPRALTGQEKAMEFMLFDLPSCIPTL
jgi:hypothetical protein